MADSSNAQSNDKGANTPSSGDPAAGPPASTPSSSSSSGNAPTTQVDSGKQTGANGGVDVEALQAENARLARELGRAQSANKSFGEQLDGLTQQFTAMKTELDGERAQRKAEREAKEKAEREAGNVDAIIDGVSLEQKELARALAVGLATTNKLDLTATDAKAAVEKGKELFQAAWARMHKGGGPNIPKIPGAKNGLSVPGDVQGILDPDGNRIA